jgi:hypothetical protein
MIFLPWIAFSLAVGWMIRQGFSEKRKYLKERAIEAERAEVRARNEVAMGGLRSIRRPQGEAFDLGLSGETRNPHQSRGYPN